MSDHLFTSYDSMEWYDSQSLHEQKQLNYHTMANKTTSLVVRKIATHIYRTIIHLLIKRAKEREDGHLLVFRCKILTLNE